MNRVALRPTDHAASRSPSCVYSFLVEVDAAGLAYERVVFDLAVHGIALHSLEDDPVHWRLVATVGDQEAMDAARGVLEAYFGHRLRRCVDRVVAAHRGGKIRTVATVPLAGAEDLALAYTPGVGRIANLIARDRALVDDLTARANTIAVVTDGTAVLGLGNLGPEAALPVMEGKAALFDRLAGINAVPLCLATTDVDEIVKTVAAIAPSFGGVNLEDIAAPRCFEIERRLQAQLQIPVFHDDQHGTAIVVGAAVRNALRLVGKDLRSTRVVVSGAGAAGTAVIRFLLALGISDVVVSVPVGVLHPSLVILPPHKRWLAAHTNPRGVTGGIRDAVAGADVFIGVSGPGALPADAVDTMATDAIVFALANPVPEVEPSAIGPHAAIVATGASDDPNQINNILAFPGVFRGALDARAARITPAMKLAACDALTALGAEQGRLLPDVLDPDVVSVVAARVLTAARAESTDPSLAFLETIGVAP